MLKKFWISDSLNSSTVLMKMTIVFTVNIHLLDSLTSACTLSSGEFPGRTRLLKYEDDVPKEANGGCEAVIWCVPSLSIS